MPPGLVLDGELLAWDSEADTLSFEGLQRRAAARARSAPALAAKQPAFYVVFDVLQIDGQELLHLPHAERRARLETLFTDHALTAPWTLCPMTTDPAKAREWLESWTDVSGVEGILCKPQTSHYMPGYVAVGPRSGAGTPPRRSSAPRLAPSPAHSSLSSAATTRTAGCARSVAPSRCARRRPAVADHLTPDRCDGMAWYPLDALPAPMVAYCRAGLDAYRALLPAAVHFQQQGDTVRTRPAWH
ncbi:hypothetical protein [Streptomyces sp. NPDC088762]|uniref:ATP-dependent DNA ligase n=1 Tax=Streptomyces sp. NPDC088762 TaxID=3365891 RepID=UPI00382A9C19